MYFNHLKFEDRVKLQFILDTHQKELISLSYLAKEIGVSKTTIRYELINNHIKTKGNTFTGSSGLAKCSELCYKYSICNTCNRFRKRTNCAFIKRYYDAYYANELARNRLIDSRRCLDKKQENIKIIEKKITPYVKAGLSLEVAMLGIADDEYIPSISTIRRYISDGHLSIKGVDLPRAARFKVKKEYRYDRRNRLSVRILHNRMYSNYVEYMKNGKHRVLQVDCIIGKREDKQVILTIFDLVSKMQFGFLIKKSSRAVQKTILKFYELAETFSPNLFDVILTDNGPEMFGIPDIEVDDVTGVQRFRVFYCDPYTSFQKGACERNHELFRYIYKKGKTMDTLTQEDVTNMFSQLANYPRASLGDKTPYDVFTKLHGYGFLEALNIKSIPLNQLNLKSFK